MAKQQHRSQSVRVNLFFLVGNVTDSNCFGGEKDVRMQLHSEVLCEILRMTSFDKGMMDSWGVKD